MIGIHGLLPGLIRKIDEGVKRIVNIGHEFNRKGYGFFIQ
jgi:hypothetical protein